MNMTEGETALAETIKAMQELPPGAIAESCSTSIFKHLPHEEHLAKYDGWMLSTIRVLSPPPFMAQDAGKVTT